jgi:hypothetical protein
MILLLGVGAACDSSPSAATFDGAEQAQLVRAFEASSGLDARGVLEIASVFAGVDEPLACPSARTSAGVTTVDGGCVDSDGDAWSGSLRITNVPPVPGYDPDRPARVVADGFGVEYAGTEIVIDGSVEVAPGNARIHAPLTLVYADMTIGADLHLACAAGACTANASSLTGDLGTAAIAGTWRLEAPSSGTIVLGGADELRFEVTRFASDDCVDYVIGDSDGTLCGSDSEQHSEPDAEGDMGSAASRRWPVVLRGRL